MIYKIEIKSSIPTINNMYSSSRQGRRFVSGKHKRFKELVYLTFLNFAKKENKKLPIYPSERLVILIEVYFTRKKRDIDNILKPILDALQGVVYTNDNQIDGIGVVRRSEEAKEEKVLISFGVKDKKGIEEMIFDDVYIPIRIEKELKRIKEKERNFWRKVRRNEKVIDPQVLEKSIGKNNR
jgi:Holliday junction resolvase RusA-like endonuclease